MPTTKQVDTNAGVINVHIFEPKKTSTIRGTIVTVHPWATLGGSEHNTIGLARHIINTKLKDDIGWRVITFNMQSTPILKGGILGGVLCAHSFEVQQIIDVMNWVSKRHGREHNTILLGSSAGAPQSGSALAQLEEEKNVNISAYVAVGYTFGKLASIGFYGHFNSIVTATSPKLFIMGSKDEFTSGKSASHCL